MNLTDRLNASLAALCPSAVTVVVKLEPQEEDLDKSVVAPSDTELISHEDYKLNEPQNESSHDRLIEHVIKEEIITPDLMDYVDQDAKDNIPIQQFKTESEEMYEDPKDDTNRQQIELEPYKSLYADHVIKEEIVIGPTEFVNYSTGLVHQPNSLSERSCALEVLDCKQEQRHERSSTQQKETRCDLKIQCKQEPIEDCDIPHKKSLIFYDNKKLKISEKYKKSKSKTVKERNIRNKEVACDFCFRVFKTKDDYMRHKTVHTGVREYKCELCKKSFRSKGSLKQHTGLHGVERYKCDKCKKKFFHKKNLIQHSQHHKNYADKEYLCKLCEKRFDKQFCLLQHMRGHSDYKPFQCDTCKMSFKEKCGLERHIRNHTGTRPYACDICGLSFTYIGNFNAHKRTHSDNRPFACNQCTKKFKTKSTWTRHIHTHSKPFVCVFCDKRYARLPMLKEHGANVHAMLEKDMEKYLNGKFCRPKLK